MQLHVVRHGQTDYNLQHRYQGAVETDLNATGIAQARALVDTLPAGIEALISSPMRRTLQTAAPLAEHLGLEIETMDQFRERSLGIFEGMTQEQIEAEHPELWRQKITRQFLTAPPEGESIYAVLRRVRHGLAELARRHADKNAVALIAHGFVGRAIWGLYNHPANDDFFAYQLQNGACATYSLTTDTFPAL